MTDALACFLGGLLIFVLEPMLGKALTPRFGSGAQVWMTCLLFFQGILLVGYAWASGLNRRLAPRRQAAAHGLLLGAALLLLLAQSFRSLPFLPFWSRPDPGLIGPGRLLSLLAASAALPMVALSATTPLVQAWYARRLPEASPFRLYAASNIGSLAGLLAYPFLVEPFLGFHAQALGAAGLFTVYAALMLKLGARVPGAAAARPGPAPALPLGLKLRWLLASMTGVLLLMGATNHLILQTAAIPLVWVGPLACYLLTFILVFEGHTFWEDPRAAFLWLFLLPVAVRFLRLSPANGNLQVTCGCLGMVFFGGLLCHGYLHRLRPAASALTTYYLIIALGGVLGGVLSALVAPVVFNQASEFCLAIFLTALMGSLVLLEAPATWKRWLWAPALAGLASGVWLEWNQLSMPGVHRRDFYGTIHILDTLGDRYLLNGQTVHGAVSLADPALPLTYYTPASGAARALEALRAGKGPLRVGVVGMGIGTLGLYAQPGDAWTFYEISPAVLAVAGAQGTYFPIIRSMRARPELILGDGRRMLDLERRAGRHRSFDLLVVDAFSSDTVPWHLLTLEALDLFLDQLAPDGILAFHISNPLPLDRIVLPLARARGLYGGIHFAQGAPAGPGRNPASTYSALYVLLSRSPAYLRNPRVVEGIIQGFGPKVFSGQHPDSAKVLAYASNRPWTDERSALSDLLFLKSAIRYVEPAGVQAR